MTDDHLSLDELAELDEGLIPPERISAIRGHLHGCGQCRARAEAITSTRSLLANLPSESMPADVKARLDRVLAEEAGNAAEEAGNAAEEASDGVEETGDAVEETEQPADAGSRSTTVVPNVISMPRRRFGRPTMAASAASVAIILAFAAVIYGHGHHSSNQTESAGASQGSLVVPSHGDELTPATTLPTSATGRTYKLAALPNEVWTLLGASRAPATSPSSSTAASPPPTAAPTPTSGKPQHTDAKSTGTASSPLSSKDFATATAPVPKSLAGLRAPQQLLACAQFVSPTAGALPIAVDFGRWSGAPFHRAPSVIFVFADGTSTTTVRVVVVGPTCAGDAIRKFTVVTLPGD